MKISNNRIAVAAGFILSLVLLAPSVARASENDRLTHFSLNHRFEVPGKVLEPNTQYVMRLADVDANRKVVQVYTDDEQHLLAQFIAINAERAEAENDTIFTFYETHANFPKPIRTWFYPARTIGLEFIYPKDQMAEITANMNSREVTATAAYVPPAPAPEPVVEAPAETPQIAQNEPAPAPEQVQEAPVEQPAVEQPAAEPTQIAELPRTAGELPMIGLIGMLCLGLGLGLKVLSSN